jgi:hypothetical protein
VDASGVAASFKDVKKADDDDFTQVLGRRPEKALDILQAGYKDPRLPAYVRRDMAKAAVGFETPKLNAIQGVAGAPPIAQIDMSEWSQARLDEYEAGLLRASAAAKEDAQ